jgi:hypothetical protein
VFESMAGRTASLLTGGAGWAWEGPWPDLRSELREIVFVYRSPDMTGQDLDPGNADIMETMLRNPPDRVPARRVSILLSLAEFLEDPPLADISPGRLPVPLDVCLAVPSFWKGMKDAAVLSERLLEARSRWEAAIEELIGRGVPVRLVTLRGERRLPHGLVMLEKELETLGGAEDWCSRLVRHPYCDNAYRWVMGSLPFWFRA